ncbi:hypothetical protein LOTGIDRAFT_170498 [Lottia gigantea]|uniref:FAD-binding domain-containing protein n=1 Tax=Lottia gigantea TaxID=225164 RepID=V3ZD64_LOTGI|nr:hypothetical protein LOTGIDRAFT_170498 [Lottia gigantea]ESO81962.1 hypothetical protein LOTGIDRAFT_170498 [Lottia gigantea]
MNVPVKCDPREVLFVHSSLAIYHILCSVLMVAIFIATKRLVESFRRSYSKLTVVVIGGGPVGLTAVLVAALSKKVSNIILFEEMFRNNLCNKPSQIAFNPKTVKFLRTLDIDFDNLEGCWSNDYFYTRSGVYTDYLLCVLYKFNKKVDLKLGTKFTRDTIKEVDKVVGRKLVIACDGSNGNGARIMGLNDEFLQHSLNAYGAVAGVDRLVHGAVPVPETSVQNILFDLGAYGILVDERQEPQGFTVKLFGNLRHRYMNIAIPKCESTLLKSMRLVLDRSIPHTDVVSNLELLFTIIMRNIFIKCFNTYKSEVESSISESTALKTLKFSPRLFEIKLSQRLETVVYFKETDTFLIAEGEAARCTNFHTGKDINLAMDGLPILNRFITMITWASSEHSIMEAMLFKSRSAERICKSFLKNGLRDTVFSPS